MYIITLLIDKQGDLTNSWLQQGGNKDMEIIRREDSPDPQSTLQTTLTTMEETNSSLKRKRTKHLET